VRYALVGNGPSAAGCGAEIDAHDRVVRFNAFPISQAADAGRRLDVWVWFGWLDYLARMGGAPRGEYQVWMPLPLSCCGSGGVGDAARIIEQARGRRIRWVSEAWRRGEVSFLGGRDPSSGFTAVDMAIRLGGATEITLYGFDAVAPDRPGFHDARGPFPFIGTAHPWRAEKRAYADLAARGLWMGERWPVRVRWPSRPEIES